MAARIRMAGDSDADVIAVIYHPFVQTTTISFEIDPPDSDQMARRVVETTRRYPWLVCELDGEVAGYAYASEHRTRAAYRWSVDTSVYVAPDFQRRGLGRGLYLSLFAILAAQGFFNAFAGITLPNPGSVALHESMGFTPVGVYRRVGYKRGIWCDVEWWQRPLRPHAASPAEPLPLAAVLASPEWDGLVRRGESAVRISAV